MILVKLFTRCCCYSVCLSEQLSNWSLEQPCFSSGTSLNDDDDDVRRGKFDVIPVHDFGFCRGFSYSADSSYSLFVES